MLHRTSDLLAHLTNYAAVVVGPRAEAVAVRSVQIVGSCRERRRRSSSCSATAASRASRSSCRRRHRRPPGGRVDPPGRASSSAPRWPVPDARCHRATTSSTACAPTPSHAVRDRSSDEHVYVGGTSAMASAFDAVEIVRDVLRTLEQQFVVVSLVGDLVQPGMSVAIGVEHGVEPLVGVLGRRRADRRRRRARGSVGVLGPTRMNYPQALATVEVVSDQLGRRLEDS